MGAKHLCTALIFTAATLACTATTATKGAETVWPCAVASLSCVRQLVQMAETRTPLSQAITQDPLKRLLASLADGELYDGTSADLDELKRRSLDLKRSPIENREAITLLDNAIASDVDELRAAVSTVNLARRSAPGTNIHRMFVEQKKNFLTSDRARFYDGGPFEIVRRSLLANALEEEFFLARKDGLEKPEFLMRELELIDEMIDRYIMPEYEYLGKSQRNLHVNSNLFWEASVLFVLGKREPAREILRELVINYGSVVLGTEDPGHVFVYRALDVPYEMIRRQGTDEAGLPKLDIINQNALQRYYNPAQLALFVCSLIESAGPDGVENFVNKVSGLDLADYYVVAGSSDDARKLVQLNERIRETLQRSEQAKRSEELLSYIEGLSGGVSAAMEQGARLCNIDNILLNRVYSPFSFDGRSLYIQDSQRQFGNYLLFGGHLNEAQAAIVADFLNDIMSGHEFDPMRDVDGLEIGASSIRARIDE
jgi:hypothetical protein